MRFLLAILLAGFAFAAEPRERQYRNEGVPRVSRLGQASASSVPACASCLTNLIAYYPFNGSLTDVAAAHNGTILGIIGYTTGKLGQAAENSSGAGSNYVAVSGVTVTGDFSVSAWVNVDTYPVSGGTLFGQESGFTGFYINGPTNKIAFYNGGFQDGTTSVPLDTWTHVLVTYNSATTTFTFYVNGVTAGTQVSALASWTPVDMLGLAGNAGLDGSLDEVAVWSRVLTAGEIAAVYNSGSGLAYPF